VGALFVLNERLLAEGYNAPIFFATRGASENCRAICMACQKNEELSIPGALICELSHVPNVCRSNDSCRIGSFVYAAMEPKWVLLKVRTFF